MIGGPSFDADVPRFGTYNPSTDPRRGHGLRLASDDLFDCRWTPTHESPASPEAAARSGASRRPVPLPARRRGAALPHRLPRQEGAGPAPGADRVPVRDQHLEGLFGHAVQPDVAGPQEVDRQQRVRQQPGRAARLLPLPAAPRRPGDVSGRLPHALARRRPFLHEDGPGREWDYSHLCRQDRSTQAWLEANAYDFDALADTDLHLNPNALDGYRVLFVVGPCSEYWSSEAMQTVSRFLDRGGSVVVLSGNTAF